MLPISKGKSYCVFSSIALEKEVGSYVKRKVRSIGIERRVKYLGVDAVGGRRRSVKA